MRLFTSALFLLLPSICAAVNEGDRGVRRRTSFTMCCSWNFATCETNLAPDHFCHLSESNCEIDCRDGANMPEYIDPATRTSCVPRWAECTTSDQCCGSALCVQLDGYNGCGIPIDINVAATPIPTRMPTPLPTSQPTRNPTPLPSRSPTPKPRSSPTPIPAISVSAASNLSTSSQPTRVPTRVPTRLPTRVPTRVPTRLPTRLPTRVPTRAPTRMPTRAPTRTPTRPPTPSQSALPTSIPTRVPTALPTNPPTGIPTRLPTSAPMGEAIPTIIPTRSPTSLPTNQPSMTPTPSPTSSPTLFPTSSAPVAVPLPVGPFITNSSERIIIPDPPAANEVLTRTRCPHLDDGLLDWQDASTWGGLGFPVPGANITLPVNSRVVIRMPVEGIFGVITIPTSSELIFGENSTGITLDTSGIDVKGNLTAGSETCRLDTPIIITLYGARPLDAVTNPREPTYKGVSVTGTVSLHGKRFYSTWTRLAKTLTTGDHVIMLQKKVNWQPGQDIIIVTTAMKDSREWHQNEVRTIQTVLVNPVPGVGAAVYLTSPVNYTHVANTGYQAEVGLLTRTIKIQGAASDSEPIDPDPRTCTGRNVYGSTGRPCANTELTGFGGHLMVHGNGTGYVEGVELFRMGQTNVLGRYPIHFHLLGDCPTCYFRDSSVHRSFYRCVSVHGTNYMNVNENVAFDVTGYCYYLEDGVEHHNTISFNLAAHIHLLGPEAPWGNAQTTNQYQQNTILTLPADVTASGFYITNVQNNIIGNAASGGWSGFAFPNLPTPLGPHRNVTMRPSSALPLIIDGNTAHSTGWWWTHAGAFYFGGSLYYNSAGILEYNPGRDFDFNNKGRNTCKKDLCAAGNCGDYCFDYDKVWVKLTNTKAFLAPSVGLGSWSGRMEIVGFEAHDVGLSIEALENGFWIDDMLAVCRTGANIALPPGASAAQMTGHGFFWYDTDQSHIITNSEFRNCGYRSPQFVTYDNSTNRGCGDNSTTGCSSWSTVFGFLTHSDQFTPEIMQGTKGIRFNKCGRRFKLHDYRGTTAPSSVSGRTQNWLDTDGSVSGLNVPTLIGSGRVEAGLWWTVDNEVINDPEGPLKFVKQTKERGIGHIRMKFDDVLHNQVGNGLCGNGDSTPCNALGYMKHMGPMFSLDNGLPITANAELAGPVGGFSWFLNLNEGAPRKIRFELVVVRPDTPLLFSIAYPPGTNFTITANAPSWCQPSSSYTCKETFQVVNSMAAVRASKGNTYHFSNEGLLTVRIIQGPKDFTGAPQWLFPNANYTDVGRGGLGFAVPRFERGGVLLPGLAYGPWLDIVADCVASSMNSAYCSQLPPSLTPDVCPTGYNQTAYDKCCSASACVYADGTS